MKKIDILNFITSFRKAPNDIKTYRDVLSHMGAGNEEQLTAFLNELKQTRVIRELDVNGEKAYQVISR